MRYYGVLFNVIRTLVFSVSSVFSLVIQLGVFILPGNKAVLTPFFRANDSEILYIGGTPLVFKVNIKDGSADTEEHLMLVHGIQIEIDILKVSVSTQRCDTVDIIMGCVSHVKAHTAADALQNDTVFTAFIGIMLFKSAQLDFNGFSYLQRNSPFSFALYGKILDFLATDEDSLFGIVSVGDDEVGVLAGLDGADLVLCAQSLGGVVGSSADSFLFGDAPAQNVAQAGPHVGSRAGDGFGANQLGNTAAKLCHLAAQIELVALRLTGAAAGVGNQDHTVLEYGKSQTDGSGMDMETVSNDLSLDLCILNTGGDDTGVTVMDTGHCVVQVGQMGDTGIHSGSGVVIGAVGVGN